MLDIHGATTSEDTIEALRLVKDFVIRSAGIENINISKSMIKDCQNSHQLYTAKLNEEKCQKRLQDENAQKEKEKEQKARELEEIDNDILVVKNGIKVADASILEGNQEIDKLLKQSNLDRNALATAHSKIAMGVKRKGELEENLKTIETKRKKLE